MNDRTNEIESRFKKSWIQAAVFYENLINNHIGWDRLNAIKEFISTIRNSGEDGFYRVGTSIHTLIISRSVDFGLRADQKYIKIDSINNQEFEITLKDGISVYRQYRIKDLNDDRLIKLMQVLKDTLID